MKCQYGTSINKSNFSNLAITKHCKGKGKTQGEVHHMKKRRSPQEWVPDNDKLNGCKGKISLRPIERTMVWTFFSMIWILPKIYLVGAIKIYMSSEKNVQSTYQIQFNCWKLMMTSLILSIFKVKMKPITTISFMLFSFLPCLCLILEPNSNFAVIIMWFPSLKYMLQILGC